jgi:cobalt-zinc-cadmium efflux system protein
MSTTHPHDHPHALHAHEHAAPASGRNYKLLFAFVLTTLMMVAEVFGGLWSGSLALLADAGHMMVDALALLLAFIGAWMATRPADARRSYGYGRMEVLVGFVNALSQFVLVGWIIYEATTRLLHPGQILSGIMLVVALAGLLVNGLILRMLHGHAHDDVNLGSASLHVLGDLLGSAAAVIAALAIRWFDWLWADPVGAHPAGRRSRRHGLRRGRGLAARGRCLDPRHPPSACVATRFGFAHGHPAC